MKIQKIKRVLTPDNVHYGHLQEFKMLLEKTQLAIRGSLIERHCVLNNDINKNAVPKESAVPDVANNQVLILFQTVMNQCADELNHPSILLTDYAAIAQTFKTMGLYHSASATLFHFMCKKWITEVSTHQPPITIVFKKMKDPTTGQMRVTDFNIQLDDEHKTLLSRFENVVGAVHPALIKETKLVLEQKLKTLSIQVVRRAISKQITQAQHSEIKCKKLIQDFNKIYSATVLFLTIVLLTN